ncbi:MAG: transposase [Candidatus Xenobiia bacterium LiM19]
MRKIKDHYSGYLFDPWYHVGAKRLNLLKNSWAGIFNEHCLPILPVDKILPHFHETMSRPSAVILQQIFDLSDVCQNCPLRDQCPTRVGKRTARFYYNPEQVRLSLRRAIEETEEWRDKYRMRAGVEGSISRFKSQTGAGRLRVRGLEKVRFAGVLKAVGINILRSTKALAAQIKAAAARMRDEISQNTGLDQAEEAFYFFLEQILSFLTTLFIEPRSLSPVCENS